MSPNPGCRRRGGLRLLPFAVVGLCLTGGGTAVRAQPPVAGIPPRLTQLSDLKALVDPKSPLTGAQKSSTLLSWLAQERRHPTPTIVGKGGFDIDSGYLQSQMLQVLAVVASPALLEKLAEENRLHEPGLRDAMRVALGLMRDRRQTAALARIVTESREPYLRWRAVQALGGLGDPAAIPALKQAMTDPFHLTRHGGSPSASVVYPVRDMARISLRVLRDPKARAELKKETAAFTARLTADRKRGTTGLSADQAVAILNGG